MDKSTKTSILKIFANLKKKIFHGKLLTIKINIRSNA